MFDIGWTELLVIGMVSLIVVGPKDLPGMFRTLGKFTAKAKSMAREFTRAMEDAADEAGVKDVAKGLKDATNPTKMGLDKIKEAADDFTKWEPGKKTASKGGANVKALSEERAEAARKIRKATADKASARQAAQEVAETSGAKPAPKPRAKPAAKPAARKAGTSKPARKPAARKPATRMPAKKPAKKPAAKGSAK